MFSVDCQEIQNLFATYLKNIGRSALGHPTALLSTFHDQYLNPHTCLHVKSCGVCGTRISQQIIEYFPRWKDILGAVGSNMANELPSAIISSHCTCLKNAK